MTERPDIRDLLRRSLLAVQNARMHLNLHRGWELLQERNAEGDARGPLPYAETAFSAFRAAHAQDREHIGAIHHLAISHHARAWDLELAGDQRAAAEWECALGYWRTVAASPAFWSGLDSKFRDCDPEAGASPLPDLRRNLLEHLLEVHIEFIRRYSENGDCDHAATHLGIVQRAKIPPAVKRRLTAKLYEGMTASVPEARTNREYLSALTLVERFLALYPEYVPALRDHAEISNDLVSSLSYKHEWDEIVSAARRAEPHTGRLVQHPDLKEDPLAAPAIEELACTIAGRASERAWTAFEAKDAGSARAAFDFGVLWGRLALPVARPHAAVRNAFAACLLGCAACLRLDIAALGSDSGMDRSLVIRCALSHCRNAVARLEEAESARPDNQQLLAHITQNLASFRSELAHIELLSMGGFA